MMSDRLRGVLAAIAAVAAMCLLGVQPAIAGFPFTAERLEERLKIAPRDGSVRYGESDFELNATGLALALRRTYSSTNRREGMFGLGWSCIFDRRVERDGKGRVSVVDEWGRRIEFDQRRGELFLSRTGRPRWLLLEKDGALLHDHCGRFWSFDRQGRLRAIWNAAMVGVEIEYAGDAIAAVRDPGGRAIRFATDGGGRIVEARSSAGGLRRYEYRGGRLVRVYDAEGLLAGYSYDADGRLVSIRLVGGERATIAYDSHGRVVELGGPAVAHRKVTYSKLRVPFAARLVEVSDALGRSVVYRFRDDPRDCQIELPSGAAATISYNERLLPVRIDLPGGRRIALEYDRLGNLIRLKSPNERTCFFAYTPQGRLIRWTRLDGATFDLGWSESGLLAEIRGPRPDYVRKFAFDDRGLLSWYSEGSCSAVVFSRNSLGDLSAIKARSGAATIFFDCDSAGRLARVSPPSRPAFQMLYDGSGKPAAVSDSVGYRLSFERDRLGRIVAVEDCEGNRERLERDRRGRPSIWQRPDGSETKFQGDREGNLVAVVSPEGNVARVIYNERNLATSQTWVAVARRVEYDEFGHVVARWDGRARRLRFVYDQMGLLTDLVHEGRPIARFWLSPLGCLLRMTSRDGEWRFGFDSLGRAIRLAESNLGTWAEYGYDYRGKVEAFATPGGRWTYRYDERGRLVGIRSEGPESLEVRYIYQDEDSRLPAQVLLPDGSIVAYTYDAYGRPTAIRANLPDGKTALAERYTFDGRGNIRRIESRGRRIEYDYDAQNRLVRVSIDGSTYARLSYGKDGRLLRLASEEGDLEILYDEHGRPVRSSRGDFRYDDDGNRTALASADGSVQYRYDLLGRLAAVVSRARSVRVGFAPNGWPIVEGRRTQTVRRFFLGDQPIFASAARGNVSYWFLPDPFWGWPVVAVGTGATRLAFRDVFGQVRAVAEVGGGSCKLFARDALAIRPTPGEVPIFDELDVAVSTLRERSRAWARFDRQTGLSLVPRSLREGIFAYGADEIAPAWPAWATARDATAESALIEEIVASCSAGRFATDEATLLRYIAATHRSPGWPSVGSAETFDLIFDGHSFLDPAEIGRLVSETVFRDGTGGLMPSLLMSHRAVGPSCEGLGRHRVLCSTLALLPPLVLESRMVGSRVWRDDAQFAWPDDALHGWMARLFARATDRSRVRVAEDGSVRLLCELLRLAQWAVDIPERKAGERTPARSDLSKEKTDPRLVERIARRDRLMRAVSEAP